MTEYLNTSTFRMPDSYYDPPERTDLVDCPDCKGTGEITEPGHGTGECESCDGTGEVEDDPYEPDPDQERDERADREYWDTHYDPKDGY